MKQPRIKKTIAFNSNLDWTEKRKSILILYFNSLGLYEKVYKDRILFKLNAQKPTDFIVTGTKRDFFKVIRNVEIKINEFNNRTISVDISVDLTYLIVISIGLGFSFFLGIIIYLKDLISVGYIITSLIIMTFTFIIGYINIIRKMNKLEHEFE